MKKLLIIRHAKSSWANSNESDFERPLNDRGRMNAPEMAERLVKRKVLPDVIISSAAKRTVETSLLMMKQLGLQQQQLIKKQELYLATPETILETILSLDDAWQTAAIIAHNPGVTDFVNSICEVKVDDMPTCAVYAVQIKTDSWKNFSTAAKEFLFFEYPKLL
ncbi:histidine phosphatase family protein [Lacibacter sp. MH-610]|uniref:SixA phosphatase family protein n=1 Tax=Lacibacter sp. MH-610 TaxID=3020883 RepID=UPI003891A719